MAHHENVAISSTSLDLPEHRRQVVSACERTGMFPLAMENLPSDPADAEAVSLRLVNEADIYIGIFGFRYGDVPPGAEISITEMEYDRARERELPCLIFLMHEDHPIRARDVETGPGAEKLVRFKERLKRAHVCSFFKSPEDLRAQVIHSLSELRKPNLAVFHHARNIPFPPEPYIAHPYTLLQTHQLVGRRTELGRLTDWVKDPRTEVYADRMLCVVAIGGMGKSALTWKWFNEVAPEAMKPLSGRLWWSFYESDASFENFLTRGLAYMTGEPPEQIERMPVADRADRLLATLDREPFLLVLDGLERLLIAYSLSDAAHLMDNDLDERTGGRADGAPGSSTGISPLVGQERLRKTSDPRVGSFLLRLSRVRAARALVSTRLFPAELQTTTGQPRPGVSALFLQGLSEDDALSLWREVGVSGARDHLLPLFDRFERHPLLIQALAGEVASYRRAPGDFDRWRADHPEFDPFTLPLSQVKSHILEFALQGLNPVELQTLQTLAAFWMPVTYDTLEALLVGAGKGCNTVNLDAALGRLEDRGLLGWDRHANRYDLHPLVRGIVWGSLGTGLRISVYGNLHRYFEALPPLETEAVGSIEDLTGAIGLYRTLIGLGHYDEAWSVFRDRLGRALRNRLSLSRQLVLLLEMLFPEGLDQPPRLRDEEQQGWVLHGLAEACLYSGRPGMATSLCQRALALPAISARLANACCHDLSDGLSRCGKLREGEGVAYRSLVLSREMQDPFWEAVGLGYLAYVLAVRNQSLDAERSIQRSQRLFARLQRTRAVGVGHALLAELALWRGDPAAASAHAEAAWSSAHIKQYEQDFIRAARRQGQAALELGDLARADERLHLALSRARAVELAEEELPALIALGELRRRQADLDAARVCLADAMEAIERGPYILHHTDALNVLARIERDAGHHARAEEAAAEAFRKAWCDGPPYAYHRGLRDARMLLAELGVPEPKLPVFDESKYEPIPACEIDPP